MPIAQPFDNFRDSVRKGVFTRLNLHPYLSLRELDEKMGVSPIQGGMEALEGAYDEWHLAKVKD